MFTLQPNRDVPDERLSFYLQAISEIYAVGSDTCIKNGYSIQRIYGGANNALYKIDAHDQQFACKLCVDDGRQRAAREFGSLQALWAAGVKIAPRPLLLDESKTTLPYPVVIYDWVEGTQLKPPVSPALLQGFQVTYHQLHNITPNDYPAFNLTAWFHWFDFNAYVDEIRDLGAPYMPWLPDSVPGGLKLKERLDRILERCADYVAKAEVDPGKGNFPLALVRVDPNLANVIVGNENRIHWVDWEYSGWGDPALDIAELRWHAALQPLGKEALQWLRTSYRPPHPDPGFENRLRVWDRILATRWPFLILRALWSNYNGPDRQRLTRVEIPSRQYHQRIVEYLDRAEALFAGKDW